MGYLLDAEWKNGQGLEDIMVWGTDPLLKFLRLFDEEYGQAASSESEDEYAVFLYYQMRDIVLDMNTVMERFLDDCRPWAKEKREKRRQQRQERVLELVSRLPGDKLNEVEEHLKGVLGI